MESLGMSPGALPSGAGWGWGGLVFQLVCRFHRYCFKVYSLAQRPQSGPRWSPAFKMELVLSVSPFSSDQQDLCNPLTSELVQR